MKTMGRKIAIKSPTIWGMLALRCFCKPFGGGVLMSIRAVILGILISLAVPMAAFAALLLTIDPLSVSIRLGDPVLDVDALVIASGFAPGPQTFSGPYTVSASGNARVDISVGGGSINGSAVQIGG